MENQAIIELKSKIDLINKEAIERIEIIKNEAKTKVDALAYAISILTGESANELAAPIDTPVISIEDNNVSNGQAEYDRFKKLSVFERLEELKVLFDKEQSFLHVNAITRIKLDSDNSILLNDYKKLLRNPLTEGWDNADFIRYNPSKGNSKKTVTYGLNGWLNNEGERKEGIGCELR